MRILEQRRFFHVLILLFKSFNGNGPSYIKVSLNFVQSIAQALSLSNILLIASGALIPLHPSHAMLELLVM